MIEIHCTWREQAAAVSAWNLPQLVQKPGLFTPFCSLALEVP
jgi:hypothetical protein